MREEWTLPGWFEDVRVVRARDIRPAERDGLHAPSLVTQRVRAWLADDRARASLIGLYDALTGGTAHGGDGLSAGGLERMIAARLERAFRERELVLLMRDGSDDSLPPLAEHAHETAATGELRAAGLEDDWIDVALFDSAGDPIEGASFIVLDGKKELARGVTGADGVGAVRGIPPGGASGCSVSFNKWVKEAQRPLRTSAPPIGPPKLPVSVRGPIDGPHPVMRRDLQTARAARLLSTNVFQLKRRQATVIEIEHFTEEGAVFLPELSPAPLREGAPAAAGLDVLKSVFRRGEHEAHVLITGHHDTRAQQRAEGTRFLLLGDREGWRSFAARHGTEEEQEIIRGWARAPLPDGKWNAETWGKVFDLYVRELVPPAPGPVARGHKLVVRGPAEEKETIYPVKMAEITWGWEHGARAQELEPLNPHLCRGPWSWRDIRPGDEIFMPETWPPKPLRDRGFKVVALAPGEDPRPPQPPRLRGAMRAVPCKARHRDDPQSKSVDRRAVQRHVEILFVSGDVHVCKDGGPCDTGHCEVYDPYAFDLRYTKERAWHPLCVTAYLLEGEESELCLVIASGGGTMRELPASRARRERDHLTWSLDPDELPNPTSLFLIRNGERAPIGQSFDPAKLRDALMDKDLTSAEALWDPRDSTTAATT